MKVYVSVSLETDGDYTLRNNEAYGMEYDGSGYYSTFEFTDDTPKQDFEYSSYIGLGPAFRACRLLEKMLCDIHVHYTHYYVLDYLYHMFNDAIEALERREKEFEASISGNYEGTFVEIRVED